jgi:hypothetical protein
MSAFLIVSVAGLLNAPPSDRLLIGAGIAVAIYVTILYVVRRRPSGAA